ncbi:DNA-directed RNA polymerase I subunit RPA12-like protein [Drosera capensis]
MAFCRKRDFMFCEYCGTMLNPKSPKDDRCRYCKAKINMKELQGKEYSYTISGEEIRKQLGIPSIFELGGGSRAKVEEQRVMVNQPCQECNHSPITMLSAQQTRSADEGQSIFYECPACTHRWKENS